MGFFGKAACLVTHGRSGNIQSWIHAIRKESVSDVRCPKKGSSTNGVFGNTKLLGHAKKSGFAIDAMSEKRKCSIKLCMTAGATGHILSPVRALN
jgi:hypothetical protein